MIILELEQMLELFFYVFEVVSIYLSDFPLESIFMDHANLIEECGTNFPMEIIGCEPGSFFLLRTQWYRDTGITRELREDEDGTTKTLSLATGFTLDIESNTAPPYISLREVSV